jgi:hypothetical protein
MKIYIYDQITFQIIDEQEVESSDNLPINSTTLPPPDIEWNQYLVYNPETNEYRIITMEGLPPETEYQRYEWWNRRKSAYPDVGVQLNKLYDDIKNGKFGENAVDGEWYQTITEIKNSIPKE